MQRRSSKRLDGRGSKEQENKETGKQGKYLSTYLPVYFSTISLLHPPVLTRCTQP